MPTVKIVQNIHAPQQQVWEFICDIEKAPEWVEVMESLLKTTENPVREGTVYWESSKIGLKETESEWEVTYFDPPHMQAHECDESDFKATLTMRVEDNGEGTCTLFHTTEYQLLPNFRAFGWILETLFIKRLMDKNLQKTVNNCKEMVENAFLKEKT